MTLDALFVERRVLFIRLAERITHNHEDAEEAVQDAMLRAFKKQDSFEGRSQLRSWVTRIVINSALMKCRRRKLQFTSLDEPIGQDLFYSDTITDKTPSAEQRLLAKERHDIMLQKLARLTPVLRDTLFCQMVNEGTLKETAEILRVPVGTVKANVSRGRKMLAA